MKTHEILGIMWLMDLILRDFLYIRKVQDEDPIHWLVAVCLIPKTFVALDPSHPNVLTKQHLG